MRLRATIAILAALLSTGCTTLTRGNATLGAVGSGKSTSLAFKADPTFGTGLSRREWRRLASAEQKALDFVRGGRSGAWGQPSGRARGTVTVSQPFSIASRECRRFSHALTVRGKRESVTGVACRSDKGPWALVS